MNRNHQLLFSTSVYNNTRFDKVEAFWVLRPDGPSIPRGRVVIESGKTKRVELELNERHLRPTEKSLEEIERGLKEWEKRRNRQRRQQQQQQQQKKKQQQQQQQQQKNGKGKSSDGSGNKKIDATTARHTRQVYLVVRKVDDRFCASAEDHLVEAVVNEPNFDLSSSSSSSASGTTIKSKRNMVLRDGRVVGRAKPIVFPAGSRA